MKTLFALVAIAFVTAAQAQSWPSQPVKIIAPFPPGGPIDSLARLVAEKFRERTGQPALVENRPGAAGNIGISAVAKAPPTGTRGSSCRRGTSPSTRR
jgi:tripartite-type tricarboxylate transporter receptor subunit TctC